MKINAKKIVEKWEARRKCNEAASDVAVFVTRLRERLEWIRSEEFEEEYGFEELEDWGLSLADARNVLASVVRYAIRYLTKRPWIEIQTPSEGVLSLVYDVIGEDPSENAFGYFSNDQACVDVMVNSKVGTACLNFQRDADRSSPEIMIVLTTADGDYFEGAEVEDQLKV